MDISTLKYLNSSKGIIKRVRKICFSALILDFIYRDIWKMAKIFTSYIPVTFLYVQMIHVLIGLRSLSHG